MSNDYFVPIIFHEQSIAVGAGMTAPFGHAGWIQIDGDTGVAKYYEYGRYANTMGVLRTEASISSVSFNVDGSPNIEAVLSTLGARGKGDITASIFQIPDGSYQSLESFYSPQLNNPSSSLGVWTPWNSCYGIVVDAAQKVGVNLNYIDGSLDLSPAGVAPQIISSNGGVIYDVENGDFNYASPMPLASALSFIDEFANPVSWGMKAISSAIEAVYNIYLTSSNRGSPLILDLDGVSGVQLSSISGIGSVYWDIDNDGFREKSGWVAGGDGLLAIDKNGNGFIDNNSELFGNDANFANGFLALDAYDTNNDNFITSADAQFNDLKVWIDANHNAVSESTEIYTLSALGITSIATTWTDVNVANNGNTIKQTSTFTQNGVSKSIVDAWFAYDNVNTAYAQSFTVDARALFLPTLRGYGNIADMHIAASLSNSGAGNLFDKVSALELKTFAQIFDSTSTLKTDVRNILFKWAGVDTVGATSRGAFVDGQELAFLEKLMGQKFLQQGVSENPYGPEAGYDLQEAFSVAFNNFYARLVSQSAGGQLFTGNWNYDVTTDTFSGVTGLDTTKLNDLKTEALALSTSAARETFWENVVRMVEYSVGTANLPAASLTALQNAIAQSDATLSLSGTVLPALIFHRPSGVSENGTAGDDTMNGSSGDDTLSGVNGNDTLNGLLGNDKLLGGGGTDTLNGGAGGDYLQGSQGSDIYKYNVGDGNDTIQDIGTGAGNVDDTILFGAGITLSNLTLQRWGGTSLTILIGGATPGQIVIEGQFGLSGAVEKIQFSDNSIYTLTDKAYTGYGTSQNDTINGITLNGQTTDTIYLYDGNDISNAGDGNDVVYGGNGSDTINGENGNDTLYGDANNDTINGGAGSDTIYGGDGDDSIHGGQGTISTESDIVYGGNGNDTLTGYNGNDVLYGQAGNDTLVGGAGNDIYVYDGGNDIVSESVASSNGADEIRMASGITSAMLTFSRSSLSGSDLKIDVAGYGSITIKSQFAAYNMVELIRFADNSTIDLLTKSYTAYGTSGNDTVSGIGYGGSTSETFYLLDGDDTVSAGAGNDIIYGGNGNDTLNGEAGNDTLYGSVGNDVLNGGADTDTVTYSDATAAVTVNLVTTTAQNTVGAGTDTITAVENIIGSAYNDTLTGTTGNNVIEGGAGNDTINGNTGTDTVSYASATAGVTFNLTTTTAQNTVGAGTDTVTNFENILGSAYNDTLTGNTAANTIEGGAGNDTMNGGTGTDVVSYASAASGVTVNLATTTAQNTIGAGTDTIAAFEAILGSVYNDILTGDSNANTITGGDGNDLIQGGLGNDSLVGGNGTDTVSYASATAAITFSLATTAAQNTVNAGTDTVSGFENIVGSGFNDTLTGDGNANTIEGGAGNDIMNGGLGIDTVSYASATGSVTIDLAATTAQNTVGAGTDTLSNFENIFASAFSDTLAGTTAANTIEGNAGNDIISAGSGADILIGGLGADTMTGGLDADTFRYLTSGLDVNSDHITDFSTAQGDKIDLKDLLVGYDAVTSAITAFVEFSTSGANTLVKVDRDGAGTAYTWQQISILDNVTGLTDEAALKASGNLIVA